MSAVEWKKLGDVCEIIKGCSLSKNDVGTGECPVILYGELYTTYGDYITSIKSSVSSELAENATPLKYNDLVLPVSSTTKEAQIGKSSVIKVTNNVSLGSDAIILRNSPNSDFLMYYINSQLFEKEKMQCVNGTTIMHLSPKKMSEKKIPMPSAEEQIRIVGILDTFTSLISNLESELDMRRKQYEHYRNQLLDFEGVKGVEWKTLGDVCEIRGRIGFRGYTREDQVEEGEGVLSLSPGNIVNGKMDYNNSTYITWQKYEESPEIKTYDGDIIFCKTGSTVGKVSMVNKLPYKATINPQLVVLKEITINSKFLFYTLGTFRIQSLVKALAGVGSVPNISQAKLSEFKIHLPSTQTQQEIVSKLDAFENLIQSLEQEIKLRKQQYEYYREKLLTFEKE